MKKNHYLIFAIIVGYVQAAVMGLIFIYFTVFIAYGLINPEHKAYNANYSMERRSNNYIYNMQPFHRHSDGFWGITREKSWYVNGHKKEAQFTFNKILPLSLLLTYIQYSARLLLIYLSIMEFIKIIKSVGSIETFKNSNIKSFRKIGRYLLMFFAFSSMTYVVFQQGNFLRVSIEFTPILLALLSFVMAEVFKEGNKLQEENQLTV